MKDYYNILNISENASEEEIKKAYRILAYQYHPDRHMGQQTRAFEDKMKEINEAADILLDKDKKFIYDNDLFLEKNRLIKEYENKKSNNTSYIKSNYYNPTDKSIKMLIAIFICMSLTAIIVISIGIYIYIIKPSTNNSLKIPEYLDFGLNKEQVILMLGEPKSETNHLLVYDKYQIIIFQGKVDGWLDAEGILNVGNQKPINTDDIWIGEGLESIILKYGNPDTFSKEIAIYDNVVLYLENLCIKEIKVI